jgi:hypothetical protein
MLLLGLGNEWMRMVGAQMVEFVARRLQPRPSYTALVPFRQRTRLISPGPVLPIRHYRHCV